jgi:hypothetical protein
MNTVVNGDFPDAPVIDATCAGYLTFRDFTVAGKSKALMLCARTKGAGGGGHYFENLMFRGDHCDVAIWLIGSECDRFINTKVYVNKKDAVCVAFTPVPKFTANGVTHEIKSPYEPNMTGSSTTELRFFGSFLHSYGYNSIGLYTQGSCADISIDSSYFANAGFASIYLDGSNANVGDTSIRNLRIEGETGRYCLYATGAVRNLLIDSGNWGSAGEVIRYEKSPDGTHGANSSAENWVIRNTSLTIQDQSVVRAAWEKEDVRKSGEDLKNIPRDQRAIIRADRMENCRIENLWIRAYEITLKENDAKDSADKNKDHGTVIQNVAFTKKQVLEYYDPKWIVVTESAKNNVFQADKAKNIVLPIDASGNQLDITNDNGVRRNYSQYGNVTNLAIQPVSSVKNPKTGDLLLVKRGEGLAIAVYNGQKWVYSKME